MIIMKMKRMIIMKITGMIILKWNNNENDKNDNTKVYLRINKEWIKITPMIIIN